jgi:hypothetical protein
MSRCVVVSSLLVALAAGGQALGACDLLAALAGTHPACCPSHDASPATPTVDAGCCPGVELDSQTPAPWVKTAVLPVVTVMARFWILPVDEAFQFRHDATAPAGARDHTYLRISTLLI